MNTRWMTAALLGCLAASCGSVQEVKSHEGGAKSAALGDDEDDDDGDEDEDDEEAIALDQVPAAAKSAALAAVPGLELSGAEKESEAGVLHFCLHGTAAGESVEVEVTTDGKVLEIERGGDDEDDDD